MVAIVTFLSDFGLDDPFVGLCHAVLARLAPRARVVDLTHAVDPGDVRRGALLLEDCVEYVPAAVHLAVVDPGVGSQRRGVAVVAGRGAERAVLVGPDNGLLWPAAERLGGAVSVWELTTTAPSADRLGRPPTVSATFHGRDVFAPAAAHVASGGAPRDLGTRIDVSQLVVLPAPRAVVTDDRVEAEIRDVDRFGNLQLTVRRVSTGWHDGQTCVVHLGEQQLHVALRRTFSDFPPDSVGLLEDSFGWLALVCNGASAAERLGARRGEPVTIAPADA